MTRWLSGQSLGRVAEHIGGCTNAFMFAAEITLGHRAVRFLAIPRILRSLALWLNAILLGRGHISQGANQ